jgi:hypothetical protein
MKVFFVAMHALMVRPRWSGSTNQRWPLVGHRPDFQTVNSSPSPGNNCQPGNSTSSCSRRALHYAEDQAALVHRLMNALTDGGTLVLEVGLAASARSEWVSVKRSIDERLFPSRGKLAEILENYAWKIIGYSVQQAGDPLTRYTVHVRRQKPFVFLLLEPPGSGKTTLCRTPLCCGEGAGGFR